METTIAKMKKEGFMVATLRFIGLEVAAALNGTVLAVYSCFKKIVCQIFSKLRLISFILYLLKSSEFSQCILECLQELEIATFQAAIFWNFEPHNNYGDA
jgi:hypothetical protein